MEVIKIYENLRLLLEKNSRTKMCWDIAINLVNVFCSGIMHDNQKVPKTSSMQAFYLKLPWLIDQILLQTTEKYVLRKHTELNWITLPKHDITHLVVLIKFHTYQKFLNYFLFIFELFCGNISTASSTISFYWYIRHIQV